MMCNYFETFRDQIENMGLSFQLREDTQGLNSPWLTIDGYDIRLRPSKGRYFLEINTYPNDPLEVLKMINHISYAPVFKSYLNEKGLKAFYPDDEKS